MCLKSFVFLLSFLSIFSVSAVAFPQSERDGEQNLQPKSDFSTTLVGDLGVMDAPIIAGVGDMQGVSG